MTGTAWPDENPRPGRAGHGWLRAAVQRGREADRQEGGAKRWRSRQDRRTPNPRSVGEDEAT